MKWNDRYIAIGLIVAGLLFTIILSNALMVYIVLLGVVFYISKEIIDAFSIHSEFIKEEKENKKRIEAVIEHMNKLTTQVSTISMGLGNRSLYDE